MTAHKHSFVVSIWMQLKHMHQVAADALFRVVVLGSQSADERVSQISPELEWGWRALVSSNWKPKTSLFPNVKNSNKKPQWDLK